MGVAEIIGIALTAASGLIEIGKGIATAITAKSVAEVLDDLDRVLEDARVSVGVLRQKLADNDRQADADLAAKFAEPTKP